MITKRVVIWVASIALVAAVAHAQNRRSAYSYVREVSGEVTVISPLNGTVEARRNLPISAGDEIRTDDPGRAEIALADGNVLHVGGGTSVQLVSLNDQQGSDDTVSAISLREGSVLLSALGQDENAVPRVDTEDVTVYAKAGSRVRVNVDPRRGSAVVVRAGSVEVKAPGGSYTVRAGNYLLAHGEEEPEIARGSFSRDRFDIWAADRLSVTYDSPQNASGQYVGEDYSGDVSSLEGYGNWDYNGDYSTYVWRPNVASGWSPYSNGSWYYTPAGLSWWSSDPWGWFPFHYGNWFWDIGWNSWCWAPGYIYSPAWVYWGYSGGYVGWCPMGYYGYYNAWNGYHHQWGGHGNWGGQGGGGQGDGGHGRGGVNLALNGNYSTRRVDLRGWNFTGANGIGATRGRMDVVPGTRVADRLGSQLAVSSRPIVVASRGGTSVQQSLRDYVREAPRTIQRTTDSATQQRLEPVLARDRELPASTQEALRSRVAVADRGRLTGPGAADIAPRGAPIGGRGAGGSVASSTRIETDPGTGRTVVRNGSGPGTAGAPETRGGTAAPSDRFAQSSPGARGTGRPGESGTDAAPAWRSRGTVESGRPDASRPAPDTNVTGRETREHWRSRTGTPPSSATQAPTRDLETGGDRVAPAPERGGQGWRSRGDSVPPARRVIEGSVPGRRTPSAGSEHGRQRGDLSAPRGYDAPRNYASPPPSSRGYSAPPSRSYSAPPSRGYSAPPSREAPRPSAPREAAPPPRSAPAPAPHAPSHSAPPPASHSAPSGGGGHRPPGR